MNSQRVGKPQGDFEIVVPTRAGKDLQNKEHTIDGQIRIETYKQNGTNIYVDLFITKIKNADAAHVASESFAWMDNGADQATRFLQKNGFRVVVMIK